MHYFFLSLGVLSSLDAVSGHGYLLSPRSRNWEAEQTQEGVWSPARGKPGAENCPQCLNTKAAMDVCGVGGAGNYDNWLDSTGVKMSWDSQATLTLGQEFDVSAVIKANHAGKSSGIATLLISLILSSLRFSPFALFLTL